ncbi:MAG: RNA polymerase sigma factor [Pseudomonadota bacterium]
MKTDDTDLAKAAGAGDRQAFAALIDRHYDGLFRLFFRLVGQKEGAEDLTHDLCLALPGKLAGFRGDAQFKTWLYRVALNAVQDRRRRAATRAKAAAGWGAWEINRRAAEEANQASLDWLAQAMATLPDDLRDTIALTMGEDMTQREAAEVLGISEGTVAWRLSEVRKHLKALKEEETT